MKPVAELQERSLAKRIRLSYIALLIPYVIFAIVGLAYFGRVYSRYEEMLRSVVAASQFSLDFKKDFDYETYLLIAGNVSPEESPLFGMLADAGRVVDDLEQVKDQGENGKRLQSVGKYLDNLETYIRRIDDNLSQPDRYEENILIWENDVQIVTSLIRDTMNEYIYYENRALMQAQQENRALVEDFLKISVGILAVILIAALIFSYVVPLRITRPIEEQVREEQMRLRKAEFELLQAQINPHFLYNTLDAIVWSAEAGNEKQVVRMVRSLSEFFRMSLNKGKEIVTVREELMHVRSYLEIQQVRYQDILTYRIDVPEEYGDRRIPKITLQPLVENALYHGIKNRRGGGAITVGAREEDDLLILYVRDDGIGMSAERLAQIREGLTEQAPEKSAIYGLYNVNERIRLDFGEEYGLSIDSEEGTGTTVEIRLPKISTEIVENQTPALQ